jgi:hypothetical protein
MRAQCPEDGSIEYKLEVSMHETISRPEGVHAIPHGLSFCESLMVLSSAARHMAFISYERDVRDADDTSLRGIECNQFP